MDRSIEPVTFLKRRHALITAAVIVGAALLAGIAVSRQATPSSLDCPVVAAPIVPSVEVMANVVPRTEYQVSAAAGGVVESIAVREGMDVRRGDVLVVLSNPALAKEAARAKADLARASAELAVLSADLHKQELTQRSEVERTRREAELAGFQVEAEAKLRHDGIISELQYRRSILERHTKEAQHRIAMQSLASLRQSTAGVLAAKRDEIRSFQANQEMLDQALRRLRVTSPIDGVVMETPVRLGETATEGQRLATVTSREKKLALSAPDRIGMRLRAGMPVRVRYGGRLLRGRLSAVSPQAKAGIVHAEAELDGADAQAVMAGTTLAGTVVTGPARSAMLLQCRQAPDDLAHSVRTLPRARSGAGAFTETEVVFGARHPEGLEIVRGASPGDVLRMERHDG